MFKNQSAYLGGADCLNGSKSAGDVAVGACVLLYMQWVPKRVLQVSAQCLMHIFASPYRPQYFQPRASRIGCPHIWQTSCVWSFILLPSQNWPCYNHDIYYHYQSNNVPHPPGNVRMAKVFCPVQTIRVLHLACVGISSIMRKYSKGNFRTHVFCAHNLYTGCFQ